MINAHDWTIRYVTTFSAEIFSLLNSIIYFHEAIQELHSAHTELSFAAFLYAIIGAIGTTYFAIFLSSAESWEPPFHRYVRLGLSEHAAAIGIISFIAIPHIGELATLDKTTLASGSNAFPRRLLDLASTLGAAALVPGLIVTVLFFFDHEVSGMICTIDRYGTRKPGGFAWDIALLGTTTALCGVLGLPPANGLIPQAPLHSESLMHAEKEEELVVVDGEEETEIREIREIRRVYEQRWSPFLHAMAILAFITPPLQRVLGLTPTSVLAGLFLFMGEQSLAVKPIVHRFFYLLAPTSQLPKLPSSVTSHTAIHAYTIIQVVATVIMFILTLTKAAPAFPLIIIALVPLTLLLMDRWWNRETLRFVDAWTFREGTPGDEEDVRKAGMTRGDISLGMMAATEPAAADV